MNRPEACNAITGEMMAIMVEAWDRVDNDPEIRVAILTGAGGDFCAGADLKDVSAKPPGDSFEGGSVDLSNRRSTQGSPVDQAADRCGRGCSHRRRHRNPAGHRHPRRGRERQVRRLRSQVGALPARRFRGAPGAPDSVHDRADILLTGRHIKAAEAKEIGLIGHVVPDGQALDKALELADLISATAPSPCRRSSRRSATPRACTRKRPSRSTRKLGMKVFMSADAKEGPRAFGEKRAPNFKMR